MVGLKTLTVPIAPFPFFLVYDFGALYAKIKQPSILTVHKPSSVPGNCPRPDHPSGPGVATRVLRPTLLAHQFAFSRRLKQPFGLNQARLALLRAEIAAFHLTATTAVCLPACRDEHSCWLPLIADTRLCGSQKAVPTVCFAAASAAA